jgi:hypothetical protein
MNSGGYAACFVWDVITDGVLLLVPDSVVLSFMLLSRSGRIDSNDIFYFTKSFLHSSFLL